MGVVDFIDECVASGLSLELAVKAARVYEARLSMALESRKANDRERQSRRREKVKAVKDGHVMSRDACDTPETKVSPRPLSKTQTPITPSPPKGGSVPILNAAFDRWWSIYPNKVGKRDAQAAFCRAEKRLRAEGDTEPIQALLFGVERAMRSRKWLDGFIPNPATWLNQDRWKDQPDERPYPPNGGQHPGNQRPEPISMAGILARRRGVV